MTHPHLMDRQNRHCIDLYGDSVDKTLTQELSMLQDIIQLTCRLQEQAAEHTRRLKQLVLRLDADLKDKDASLQVGDIEQGWIWKKLLQSCTRTLGNLTFVLNKIIVDN